MEFRNIYKHTVLLKGLRRKEVWAKTIGQENLKESVIREDMSHVTGSTQGKT